jgi:1-acyl-sn-glycerol-3-phosphate acyltransferase
MGLLTAGGRTRMIRGWCRALLRACGVRLVVRGTARLATRPDPLGTLITANHVSWLDIPAVLAVEPVRVLAKSDVRGWPIVGRLTARAGAIFIDRRRLLRLPATVAEIAMALERGYSVLAFPEGSTWCGRTQGRFYPAVFQAAIDAGGAVRPLALRYTLADGTPTTLAAFVGDDTLFRSVWRVVTTRGLVVEVEIGPALQACDVSRRALATQSAGMVKQLATAGRRSAEVD